MAESALETLRHSEPEGDVPLWLLLQHLFNHQAHHRGQVTTLFTQCGLDIDVTDLNDCYFELGSIPD
jgi:uncharacterized damage-inducible protein DinB